jgi:L-seryl-tRNA(Ser) seleniumtransferase
LAAAFPDYTVAVETCRSQIGSGALPVDRLASVAVTLAGDGINRLAAALRALPRPVIGRVAQDRLWLDCRCLEPEEEPEFLAQLSTPG